MRRKPSEATIEEAHAEADALRDEFEEADRLGAPLFFEQFYGIAVSDCDIELFPCVGRKGDVRN